jgi:hypothetical protein
VVDSLGHIWLRTSMPAFTTFGRDMPVWGMLAYGTFYGIFAYVLYRVVRAGADRRRLRIAIGAMLLYNLAMEPLLIALHLYVYYGRQPMSVLGYPAFWPVLNVTGIVLAAAVAATRRKWFAGGRAARALLLVPVCVAGGSIASGLPVFTALNTRAPGDAGLWAGALITIAVGLVVMEAAVRMQIPQAAAAPAAPVPVREPLPVHSAV